MAPFTWIAPRNQKNRAQNRLPAREASVPAPAPEVRRSGVPGSKRCLHRCPFGLIRLKNRFGDSWFTWFNQLPGRSIYFQPKRTPGCGSTNLYQNGLLSGNMDQSLRFAPPVQFERHPPMDPWPFARPSGLVPFRDRKWPVRIRSRWLSRRLGQGPQMFRQGPTEQKETP